LLCSFDRQFEFVRHRLQEQKSSDSHQPVHLKPGRSRRLGVGFKHADYNGYDYQRAVGVRTHRLRGARVFLDFVFYCFGHVSRHDRYQPIFLHRQMEHLHQNILEEKSTALRRWGLGSVDISVLSSTFWLGGISLHTWKIVLFCLLAFKRPLHVFHDLILLFRASFGHDIFLLQHSHVHAGFEKAS